MTTEVPTITTHLGHAGWDDHEVRGVVLFGVDPRTTSIPDLMLLTLGIPPHPKAREVVSVCVQAGLNPDPRIPPMKLVRLGAAHGHLLTALATGFVGMQSSYVGMTALSDAAHFLSALQGTLGWDFSDEQLDAAIRERRRNRTGIFGFGVPGRPVDERIVWLSARLEEFLDGPRPWWSLFERTGALLSKYRRQPNFGGGLAAAMLDLGGLPEHTAAMGCLFGLLPLVGNAFEGAQQAPVVLQELPPEVSVHYVGEEARVSPRAAGRPPEES